MTNCETYSKVEYWYDRHIKSWTILRKDNEDNQVGNADYVYSKREALCLVNEYKNKIMNNV